MTEISVKVKEWVQLYLMVCTVALALKYGIKGFDGLGKRLGPARHTHYSEHDSGDLIKLVILLALAVLLFFMLRGAGENIALVNKHLHADETESSGIATYSLL